MQTTHTKHTCMYTTHTRHHIYMHTDIHNAHANTHTYTHKKHIHSRKGDVRLAAKNFYNFFKQYAKQFKKIFLLL